MRKKLMMMVLLGLAGVAARTLARETAEQKRIDYLVHVVADLKGAQFIRNGVGYDAAKAAEHLERKLHYAGERIATAEQFIDKVGTASSMTGTKYLIRLPDGKTMESAEFLRGELAKYRDSTP